MYFEGQWWMAVETPKVLLVYGKTPGEGLYQNKGQNKGLLRWDSPGGHFWTSKNLWLWFFDQLLGAISSTTQH